MKRYKNLKDLRERLYRYQLETVARFAQMEVPRLQAIEEGRVPPTVWESEELANLYGLDADTLFEWPIHLATDDAIGVLASLEEFHEISDRVKMRIVSAANAARDVIALKRQINTNARNQETTRICSLSPQRKGPPWAEGRYLAETLRRKLGLGKDPIRSMRDLVADAFPQIVVLYADFHDPRLAGLTFVDKVRGPTIVLNLGGKNQNPCVRRFSLAHELCHVLVDQPRREPLATISGFWSEPALEREQRANAFACRLLCPEDVLNEIAAREKDPVRACKRLIGEFGLHYRAARLYLRNSAGMTWPDEAASEPAVAELIGRWTEAEEPFGVTRFPIPEVPPERRTWVAELAARLYSRGGMSRDAFASLLGLTPVHDVEKALDWFGFDPPSEMVC